MNTILTSRRFWVALFTIIVTFIVTRFPAFNLDPETATGFVIVAVTYLLGLAVDPGQFTNKWSMLLQSRKFWAAVIGFAVLILNGFGVLVPLGITSEQIIGFVTLLGGYIASVAFEKKPVTPISPTP